MPNIVDVTCLIKTVVGDNSNKIWRATIYDNYTYLVEYGRVGNELQKKLMSGSEDAARRRIQEKLNKGYRVVPIAVQTVTDTVKYSDNPKIDDLIRVILKEAGEEIKSYLAIDLEHLEPHQIVTARRVLRDISGAQNPIALLRLIEYYYNLIPTKLPARIDPDELVQTFDVAEQYNRLDQLEAGVDGNAAQTKTDYQVFADTTFTWVDPADPAYTAVKVYITRTGGDRGMEFDLFKVKIAPERAAFLANPLVKAGVPTPHLFHGTQSGNVRHILNKGLIVPPHATNGRRFGPGIYFADKFQRSRVYSHGRHARFMFLNLVALGRTLKTDREFSKAPVGYDSVWGTNTRSGRGDEFVVKPDQQTIDYLIKF